MIIVQVIESFFPDSIGGTETYVLNISKCFIDAGHEVHVIAPSVKGEREYEYDGIYVHRYPIDKVATKDEYKQQVPPKGFDKFIAIVKNIAPDVVHFNTFNRSVNQFHLVAVKKLGIKTYLTPHISGIFCATGSLLDWKGRHCDGIVNKHDCIRCYLNKNGHNPISSVITKLTSWFIDRPKALNKFIPASAFLKKNRIKEFDTLNRYADGVIALSPWIEDALRANGVKNVKLVRQGISEKLINRNVIEYQFSDKLRLIYVGRVYQIKNLETLYNAVKTVDSSKLELTMACVCGNDDYAQRLKSMFCALPNVKWHENVPQKELGEMIREQDFLVLTSVSEMSPLVILESFANGCPVIATDIPPVSDNVESEENGILFQVGDSKELSQIFIDLINNSELKTALRSKVKLPRTFQDVSSELLEIYKD